MNGIKWNVNIWVFPRVIHVRNRSHIKSKTKKNTYIYTRSRTVVSFKWRRKIVLTDNFRVHFCVFVLTCYSLLCVFSHPLGAHYDIEIECVCGDSRWKYAYMQLFEGIDVFTFSNVKSLWDWNWECACVYECVCPPEKAIILYNRSSQCQQRYTTLSPN